MPIMRRASGSSPITARISRDCCGRLPITGACRQEVRDEFNRLGLAKDEFIDNDNWPTQLYVREARRMIGAYVMTEHNCRGKKWPTIRSAWGRTAWIATTASDTSRRSGHVQNEGDVQVAGFKPYPISYRAIMPKADECENLLVPVCLSSSHIAYGSIRMEPVFMILGSRRRRRRRLRLTMGFPCRKSTTRIFRKRLQADGQKLEWGE